MKDVYNVTYRISDRGITYPEKTEEVIVPKSHTVEQSTQKLLNKYRYAMGLSTKFSFEITKKEHNGWCK